MDTQKKSGIEKEESSDKAGVIERGSGIRSIGMNIVEYGTGLCLILVLFGYFLTFDCLEKKGCIVKSITEISARFNNGEIIYGLWITFCLTVMIIGYFALWGAWRITIDYVCNREYKATIYWAIFSFLSFAMFLGLGNLDTCIGIDIHLLLADKGLLLLLFGYFFLTVFAGISIAIKVSYGKKLERMKLLSERD